MPMPTALGGWTEISVPSPSPFFLPALMAPSNNAAHRIMQLFDIILTLDIPLSSCKGCLH